MMRYKPSDRAAQLKTPVLVSLAENAPRGEFISYPVAHFEFYRPDVRAMVLKDQINFLQKHLMTESTPAVPSPD